MKVRDLIKSYLGAAILAGALVFAVIRVAYNQMTYAAPDVTTIRICHWQLESGFRDALDVLIQAYQAHYLERHGKRVRVVQMPISERGYRQFMNTSLIGGTAPDIIEKGGSAMANDPSYIARFFLPLGPFVDEPNPYNEGTSLEGVPWRETIFDGMQSAYDRHLLDYYHIPFSMFTVRIYYNHDLYKDLTGRTEPPSSFEDFLAACRELTTEAERRGKTVVAIAGSKYQGSVFTWRYLNPFWFDLVRLSDKDFNGNASVYEVWQAYQAGQWRFDSPRMLAASRCLIDVAQHFQQGWLAALRDDAVFLFVQGRAVMFASGSWDASSIVAQVGNKFDVSIFDFPMPTDHPEYGQYVPGPASEGSIGGGIPWAISKQSKHADLAIDFLRFCTTKARNEQFNQSITWLPVVRGAQVADKLKAFRPRIEGFGGGFQMRISTEASLVMKGKQWPLFAGQISPEDYATAMTEVYERTSAQGYKNRLEKDGRNARNLERVLVGRMGAYYRDEAQDGEVPTKVLQLVSSAQYFNYTVATEAARFEKILAEEAREP